MRFVNAQHVRSLLEGRSIAIVGSGPGVLDNPVGLVDSFDVVVRVNNFKIKSGATGRRCDVHYSFYGTSIRVTAEKLKFLGCRLCMCKCPDAHAIESRWHLENDKMMGVDFRWIYKRRRDWWFCDTFVPSTGRFLQHFELLGRHVPTTGFAAILDVLSFDPAAVFLTGFDFFASGVHNVDEKWTHKNSSDPIGHVPEREREWLRRAIPDHPITVDARLASELRMPGARHSSIGTAS